jgi:hypothetical protein
MATVVPKDSSMAVIDGVQLGTDADRVMEQALVVDLNGDGTKDGVAWTKARSEAADSETTGELEFYGGPFPAGRIVGKMPPFVPTGPGCKHSVVLMQTGPRTVLLDISARCESAMVPRSPSRGLFVIAPAADKAEIVALRLADPAPGEILAVAADSNDRDGDGRDDVKLTFTLHTEGTDEVSADLVWLDRAAGAARDTSEPAKSLVTFGSGDQVKPPGKTPSSKMAGRVGNARRLYATLCAEGGTARVFDAEGEAIACRDVSTKLSSLLDAEVRAAITRKDVLGAVAALGRDGFYQARLSEKSRTALEKAITSATTSRAATERPIDAAPRAKSGLPRYSPLAFEPDGALLVQTADGMVRFRDDRVEDATDAADPWPLTVGGGTEPRWMGIAFPCDRSEVSLLLSDATGTPLPSRPTALLAPRPGVCKGHGQAPDPSAVPLEWTAAHQAGLIAGGVFGVAALSELGAAPARGAPRSADGKTLVVPWTKGLLVLRDAREGKAETWTVPAWPALTDCVVANQATGAACIRGERAVYFRPEPPAGPKVSLKK